MHVIHVCVSCDKYVVCICVCMHILVALPTVVSILNTRMLASSTIFSSIGDMAAFFRARVEKCVDLGHPVPENSEVLEVLDESRLKESGANLRGSQGQLVKTDHPNKP